MRRTLSASTIVLCCLSAACLIAFREYRQRPDGLVHVRMLDVGQGDGIFITGPEGQQILVDGGPDLSGLTGIAKHMSFFDRDIDVLVLTHPHLDHVASFPEILQRYRVGLVMFTGVDAGAAPYRQMLKIMNDERTHVLIADPAKDLDLGGGMTLDILWPPPEYAGVKTTKDLNDTSVVAMLRFGADSMLLTGDMEGPEEDELLASGEDIRANILKVGHHGSRTSTSTGLLLAVDPDVAVISAGRNNNFGHPHASTIARFGQFGIPVHVTAWEGEVDLTMHGMKNVRLIDSEK